MRPLQSTDPRVLGPFELLAVLGQGGMGRAYLARRLPLHGMSPEQEYTYRLTEPAEDEGAQPLAVVKVVKPDLLAEDSSGGELNVRARFVREVDAVRTVVSARVPGLLAADPEADRPWLAMEYIHGPTLHEMVRDDGVFGADDPSRYAALGLALVDALRDIHGAGLLHRDLKPGNVVLGPCGPVVLDFGLAVLAERRSSLALTVPGRGMGTVGYVPMEQYRDARSVRRPGDVYALGATLFYAATGRAPYPEGPRHTPPDVSDLPPDFIWLLSRIITSIPEQRPSLDEVEEELTGLLSGHGVSPSVAAERLSASVAASGLVPVLPEPALADRPDPSVRQAAQQAVDEGAAPDAPWADELFDELELEPEPEDEQPPQYTPTVADPEAAPRPAERPAAADSPPLPTSYRLRPPQSPEPAGTDPAAAPRGALKAAEGLRRRYAHSRRL